MDSNRFIQLLESYLQNRADDDEQQELFLMIASGKYDAEITSRINASFEEESLEMDASKTQEILQYITREGHKDHKETTKNPKVIPLYRRSAFRWVAAACIIIAIATLAVVGVFTNNHKPTPAVATTHDVPAPTNTRAVITLADGSKVYLDSAGNGVLAQQNNVNVVRNEKGEIVYAANSEQRTAISPVYNTLFNPRGSKVISLTLSDGTKVWLNSESSLRYPASFVSNTREVEITGEAYFEVKHNSKQPFKVHLPNGSIVEDIGTSFNINAYPDEEATKTTLIEGSIKISAQSADKNLRNQREKILKPGEQARLTANSQWLTTNPDLGEVMAWKNGRFQFNRTPLPVVLRQLSRWYDIDVEYHGNVPDVVFAGRMGRDLNLSQVLIVLNKMEVNFKIEGKKLIVMP